MQNQNRTPDDLHRSGISVKGGTSADEKINESGKVETAGEILLKKEKSSAVSI